MLVGQGEVAVSGLGDRADGVGGFELVGPGGVGPAALGHGGQVARAEALVDHQFVERAAALLDDGLAAFLFGLPDLDVTAFTSLEHLHLVIDAQALVDVGLVLFAGLLDAEGAAGLVDLPGTRLVVEAALIDGGEVALAEQLLDVGLVRRIDLIDVDGAGQLAVLEAERLVGVAALVDVGVVVLAKPLFAVGVVPFTALDVDDLAFGFGVLYAGGGVVFAVLGLGDGAVAARLVGKGIVAFAGLRLGGTAEGRGGLQHFSDVLHAVLGLGGKAVVGEGLDADQGQDRGGERFVLEHVSASWDGSLRVVRGLVGAVSAGSPARSGRSHTG
ncbi:hypothetical protein FQZ97_802200 [compost metagenome]